MPEPHRRENLEEVPILAAPACEGYRNKAQYPVARKNGKAYAGFFKEGTHEVVQMDRCRILPEETDRVKSIVIDYVNERNVPVYDESTHRGLLRHIYVRRGAVSGQILVCLVVNGDGLPKLPALIEALKAVPGFTTLVLSVNTKKGNAVLGDKFVTLYGPGYIEDTLCGLNFRLSARSFYQVNHAQAQRLYETGHCHGRHYEEGPGAGPLLRRGHHHPGHGLRRRKGHRRGGGSPGH